jgi:hypothetical protein
MFADPGVETGLSTAAIAMSEHSLPPDHSSWPNDPFRLLGVTPGVSARDLRKAYLRLIRSYKPEHSPVEFQKIRQAYETALALARHLGAPGDRTDGEAEFEFRFEPGPGSVEESEPSTPERHEPSADPWELACDGSPEPAYQALLLAQERGNPSEEVFLQLYWLLALLPGLDSSRLPIDWLIRGLSECGPRAGRLRELIRRELASDSALALGDRVFGFFKRKSPPALVVDVAGPRWKAARSANRWSLILADVQSLRGWLPEVDTETWARLLLAASTNLAWAERPDSDQAVAFCREVEHLGHHQQDYASELYQVEFIQIIKAGIDRLGGRNGGRNGGNLGLFALLSSSWDEPDPEQRRRLRSYVDQIAHDPPMALEGIDRIHGVAPAVLGRLSSLLGGLDLEDSRFHASKVPAGLAPAIDRFLREHRWNDYRSLRLSLLRFCLKEAISPGLIARTLAETPEFVLTGKSPLAHAIAEDWPLRHVYRASELSWEDPAKSRFSE